MSLIFFAIVFVLFVSACPVLKGWLLLSDVEMLPAVLTGHVTGSERAKCQARGFLVSVVLVSECMPFCFYS